MWPFKWKREPKPEQPKHTCQECRHLHRGVFNPECWRNGGYSYIFGRWKPEPVDCCSNYDGTCHFFEDKMQAALDKAEGKVRKPE